MSTARFLLPDFLPNTSGTLADELAEQEEKLAKTGLSELLARIENLGHAQPGFAIRHGAVCTPQLLDGAEKLARELIPWRKGPFELGGLQIDAEWRSDIKWNRLSSHLPDMKGKTVADVGCNNGYYLYRIAEAGARHILGLDPTLKYYLQYRLIAAHTGSVADFLPLGWQALWQMAATFDVIFLMGVNYHEPEPLELFHACRHALRAGGALICESVVVETPADLEIFPEAKYAGISGVYAIPSPQALRRQLQFVGFQNVTLLYSERLLITEQRRSEFSPQPSLADHLCADGRHEDAVHGSADPDASMRSGWSKEGYPPPYRAALLCRI